MRFLERILIATVAALVLVASAGAGAMARGYGAIPMAHSYSGSWPVTVTHSGHSNGTYCLTLTDNGSDGWPHSGPASVVIGSLNATGSFQLINNTLVATISVEGYGQNAALLFIASASRGSIGQGVFEDAYDGQDFDSGALAFGMKGGC